MMPILVKGDDVKSGTKANAHHSRLWAAWESFDPNINNVCKHVLYMYER